MLVEQRLGNDQAAARLVRRLDIVVNNAGIALHGGLADTTAAVYDDQMAVNARAPLFVAQAAAERMPAGGRIITLSTGVTKRAHPELLAYAMSKAAVEAMTLTLAKELAPRGITGRPRRRAPARGTPGSCPNWAPSRLTRAGEVS